MSALRGIMAGALGLAALQAIVSSRETGNLAKLLKLPGDWARAFLDPARPLIPDVRTDATRSVGAAIASADGLSPTKGLDRLPPTTGGTGPTLTFPPTTGSTGPTLTFPPTAVPAPK